jgi:hypothetical protein
MVHQLMAFDLLVPVGLIHTTTLLKNDEFCVKLLSLFSAVTILPFLATTVSGSISYGVLPYKVEWTLD